MSLINIQHYSYQLSLVKQLFIYHLLFNFRPYDAKNPYLAPVKENRELHGPTSERSCMHIEFNIEGSKMRYEAGDHLAVYPVNNAELVNKIGAKCGVDLDTIITLTNTDGKDNLQIIGNIIKHRLLQVAYLF